jgi:ribonucleoside-diphosphate reductase alpha chain
MPPQVPNDLEELQRKIGAIEREVQTLKGELEKARTNPHRRRLQATRRSHTHKFAIGEHEGYMTVGMFDDGSPGEVFLTMAKEGSTIGGLMDTIGILTSLALQYGVPVETLACKLEHVNFEPNGWTRDPVIRRASSVVDYIFRWLGLQFSETYRKDQLAICLPTPTEPAPEGLTSSP